MPEALRARPKQLLTWVCESGQAMVEFALIAVVALAVMLIGIQFAIIGQAALAVSQASFVGARAASVNETLDSASLKTAIANEMSPTISATAQITLTPGGDASCTAGAKGGRSYGCPINVTVSYDATGKIFLPSKTLLGIKFPTNLSSTESAMTE